MIVVQTFNRVGWPPNSPIELRQDTAAAILTAVRDYEKESGRNLHGDYLVAPLGGLRTVAQVTEMQHGFDLHKAGLPGWQPIYEKYNMDESSKARPAMNTHTLGICADISDSGFRAWLKGADPQRPTKNRAARYGLVFTLSPPLSTLNDLDHCQFFPGTNTVALDVTGLNNTTQKGSTVLRFHIDNPQTGNPNLGHDFFVEPGLAVTHSATAPQTSDLCYRHGAPGQATPDTFPLVNVSVTDFAKALAELGFPADAANVAEGAIYTPPAAAVSLTAAQITAIGKAVPVPAFPTIQEIGAEVIRQQKLPGN